MPKKSTKNPEPKPTETLELIPIENPEPKAEKKREPKARKRTARKASAVADSVPADAPEREQDDPELTVRSADANRDLAAEARTQAESEAKASAADTFEQAFDDTEPSAP